MLPSLKMQDTRTAVRGVRIMLHALKLCHSSVDSFLDEGLRGTVTSTAAVESQ